MLQGTRGNGVQHLTVLPTLHTLLLWGSSGNCSKSGCRTADHPGQGEARLAGSAAVRGKHFTGLTCVQNIFLELGAILPLLAVSPVTPTVDITSKPKNGAQKCNDLRRKAVTFPALQTWPCQAHAINLKLGKTHFLCAYLLVYSLRQMKDGWEVIYFQ